jgi:hypothetical protein
MAHDLVRFAALGFGQGWERSSGDPVWVATDDDARLVLVPDDGPCVRRTYTVSAGSRVVVCLEHEVVLIPADRRTGPRAEAKEPLQWILDVPAPAPRLAHA